MNDWRRVVFRQSGSGWGALKRHAAQDTDWAVYWPAALEQREFKAANHSDRPGLTPDNSERTTAFMVLGLVHLRKLSRHKLRRVGPL